MTPDTDRFLNKLIQRRVAIEVWIQRLAVGGIVSARERLLGAVVHTVYTVSEEKSWGKVVEKCDNRKGFGQERGETHIGMPTPKTTIERALR